MLFKVYDILIIIMMMMIVQILCPVLPAFCSVAYETRDDVQIILCSTFFFMMMIFRKLHFRSVGKMGGETRAGPGSLKLKTGFSDI